MYFGKNGSIFLNEDVIEIELREQWPPRIRFKYKQKITINIINFISQ